MKSFDFCADIKIEYPNLVLRGAVGHLGGIVRDRLPEVSQVVVVSDERVAALYENRLKASFRDIASDGYSLTTFPPGESQKAISTVKMLVDSLLKSRVHRRALMVVLGGGVVCDTAGFAASIYMRGIDYINVPTTLIGQIDMGYQSQGLLKKVIVRVCARMLLFF